ncbi:MAG: FAD-binding oxidoreductase [Rhodobacteraceae bacterium]|nr:FAD-binding oxidoreductase [Paracoccaceae bacterium]
MNLLHANDRPGAYPPSWYAATVELPAPLPPLRGETRADVCVVGGGYTGLSAALHLAGRGYDVALLEAQRVGFGASGRNGGQVGSGQRLEVDELERRFGREMARRLWDFGEEAKALVRQLIDHHGIPANWTPGVAHAMWHDREVRHAHALAEKLARDYGYGRVEPLDRAGMRALVDSPVYRGGAVDWGAAHIHPLAYALGLASAARKAGVRIYEGSEVHHVAEGPEVVARTGQGAVHARHLVLAGNGYLGGLNRHVAARVMPINNFIVATEPLGPRAGTLIRKGVAVADSKFVVNYFRLSPDGRLLFGGGESYGYRFPDIAATVRRPMARVFPDLADVRIDYAWGGTLAITRTRLPCFARPAPNILSASGYSGHGVALATLAGKILAEAIAGQTERFDVMASLPTPPFPGGAALRWPILVLAMTWYALRDRLGI